MQSILIKGFDVGSSKITGVIGQYFKEDNKLNIVGVATSPSLGFKKSQIINLDQATQTIKNIKESVERMTGTKLDNCHLTTSGTHFESIVSQGYCLIASPNGEVSRSDVAKAVEASKTIDLPSGKEIIHVIPQKFSLDEQKNIVDPVGMVGSRLEVTTTIILASTSLLKNLYRAFANNNINLSSLSFSGISGSMCALNTTDKELGSVLVDIGGNETSVTVFSEQTVLGVYIIPVGGNNITNDLAIGLRLTLEDAQKIKHALSSLDSKSPPEEIEILEKKISTSTAINGIIKPRLEDLFTLVNDYLEEKKIKHLLNSGAILCGGGALTINCQSIAGKILNMPIRLANICPVGGLVEDISSPGYVSTIGLIKQHAVLSETKDTIPKKDRVNPFIASLKKLLHPLFPQLWA